MNENINKVDLLFISTWFIFPILKLNQLSYLMIIGVLYFLYKLISKKITLDKFVLKTVLKLTIWILPILLSVLWTTYPNSQFNLVDIPFAIPVILIVILSTYKRISIKQFSLLIKWHTIFVLIYILLYYNHILVSLNYFLHSNLSFFKFKDSWEVISSLPIDKVRLYFRWNPNQFHLIYHKNYISQIFIFNLLSFILIGESIKIKSLTKFAIFGLIIFYGLCIYYLNSVFSIIIYISIIVIYLFTKLKRFKWPFFIAISIIISIFYLKNNSVLNNIYNNNIKNRIEIYEGVLKISKNDLIFGSGIGSVQPKLNDYYKSAGLKNALRDNLNTHNYYLHLILATGITGLIVFLYSCFFGFNLFLIQKFYIPLLYLLQLFILLFIENYFARIHGQYTYGFVMAFWILLLRSRSKI